jgi:predicted transcriptional regulator
MNEEKQNYKQKIDKVIKEINETDKDKNNDKLIKKYNKLKKKYNIIINNGLLYIKNLNMDKDNTILLLTEILNNFTDNIAKIQEED